MRIWFFSVVVGLKLFSFTPVCAMEDQGGAEKNDDPVQQISKEELENLLKEAKPAIDEARKEMQGLEKEFDEARQEMREILREMKEEKKSWLKDFKNKRFATLPLNDHTRITFEGKDILRFLFLISHCLADYYLYKDLTHYYSAQSIAEFAKRREMLCTLADQTMSYNKPSLTQQMQNIQPIHLDSTPGQNTSFYGSQSGNNELDAFFQPIIPTGGAQFSPQQQEASAIIDTVDESKSIIAQELIDLFPQKRKLSLNLILNLSTYIVLSELLQYAEHAVFPIDKKGIIGALKAFSEWADKTKKNGLEISSWTIVSFLSAYWLGAGIYAQGGSEATRGFLLRLVGWHHKALDSYWFYLAKRMVVLLYFMRQNNAHAEKSITAYMQRHADEFNELLKELSLEIKIDPNKKTYASEKAIIKLFQQAPQEDFLPWLKFKNTSVARTNMVIEALLLTPVFYHAGKWLYNNYEQII